MAIYSVMNQEAKKMKTKNYTAQQRKTNLEQSIKELEGDEQTGSKVLGEYKRQLKEVDEEIKLEKERIKNLKKSSQQKKEN